MFSICYLRMGVGVLSTKVSIPLDTHYDHIGLIVRVKYYSFQITESSVEPRIIVVLNHDNVYVNQTTFSLRLITLSWNVCVFLTLPIFIQSGTGTRWSKLASESDLIDLQKSFQYYFFICYVKIVSSLYKRFQLNIQFIFFSFFGASFFLITWMHSAAFCYWLLVQSPKLRQQHQYWINNGFC